MKRKQFILFSILLSFFLTACTEPKLSISPETDVPEQLNPKNPTKVVLWHYYVSENQQVLDNAIVEFNKTVGAEKGIIVEGIAKGSIAELEKDVSDSAKGVINSEPMPDIFSSYPDKAIEIDALGMLTDLNQYFTGAEKSEYISGFLSDGIFNNNRFLILPIVKSTELLYINASAWNEFLKENPVDNSQLFTWEGILATSRQYYQWTDAKTPEVKGDGNSMMGLDSIPNYILIGNKQLGKDFIDAEKKQINLYTDFLRKAFDIYVGGFALEYFNASGKFRSDNIKSGDLIAYTGSSSSAAYFPTAIEKDGEKHDIDFLALPYPIFEGGQHYVIQQGAGMCVSKSTPLKQEAAAIFLKWFTQKEQNINFSMSSGYLPVKLDAYKSDIFKTSLAKLEAGSKSQKNVASVYVIALEQIDKRNAFAAKPFEGSYKIRFILLESLSAAAEDAKNFAQTLKNQNLTEEEILSQLDMDSRFQNWLEKMKEKFSIEGISYQEF